MTTTTDTLRIPDVISLNEIVSAASETAKVAWVNDDGDVQYGIARHIVQSPEFVGFLRNDQDVRDGFLRITGKSGFEHFLNVRGLITLHQRGEFSKYDW